jgi:hypothetical protein
MGSVPCGDGPPKAGGTEGRVCSPRNRRKRMRIHFVPAWRPGGFFCSVCRKCIKPASLAVIDSTSTRLGGDWVTPRRGNAAPMEGKGRVAIFGRIGALSRGKITPFNHQECVGLKRDDATRGGSATPPGGQSRNAWSGFFHPIWPHPESRLAGRSNALILQKTIGPSTRTDASHRQTTCRHEPRIGKLRQP